MTKRNHAPQPLTFEIVGGLGNQLFAAAAALVAERQTGRPIAFDVSFFDRVGPDREYELGAFPRLRTVPTTTTAFSGRQRYVDAACRRLRITQPGLYREHAFQPSVPGFDPRWPVGKHVNRVKGYFQSWKYFEDAFDVTREAFTLEKRPDLLVEVERTVGERFIAAHVRRGDYMTQEARTRFGLPSDDYLLQGLAVLRSMLGADMPVVLFTDSPEHVPPPIQEASSLTIGPDAARRPVDDLLTMAAGSGVLLSNSSFSWWGAFLGQRSDRPVIAPRPWFRGHQVPLNDLLLPSWLALDARYDGR